MKLVIFTPASVKSAIGRMAALVTRELVAQGCEVVVVRTEADFHLSSPTHDFGAPVVPWDDDAQVIDLVRHADACVYQIGNSFDFHEGGLRWLAEYPGIVCLHDFFLGHLFLGWAEKNRARADAVLRQWYGDGAAEVFSGFSNSDLLIEGARDSMPLTEWICSQAAGVITHSQWGCDRVLSSCPGPVKVVPLAYDACGTVDSVVRRPPLDQGALNLVTVGHINSNKRVMSVIEAIGRSSLLRQRVRYRLVGFIEPAMRDSLTSLATRLGVDLLISGEVARDELHEALAESDVVSCLRWPALEAASASAIEAMLYGKVVIVTNTGFYSEIPDSYVVKIDYDHEIDAIQSTLIALIEEPTQVGLLGRSAQEWAETEFTATNYAAQLLGTVLDTSRSLPALKGIAYFTEVLQRWSYKDDPAVREALVRNLQVFELGESGLGSTSITTERE